MPSPFSFANSVLRPVVAFSALLAVAACGGSGRPAPFDDVQFESGRTYAILTLAAPDAPIGYGTLCQTTSSGAYIANTLSILLDCDDPDAELVFGQPGAYSPLERGRRTLGDGTVLLVSELEDLDPDNRRVIEPGRYVLAGRATGPNSADFVVGPSLDYEVDRGAVHYLGVLGAGGRVTWEAPDERRVERIIDEIDALSSDRFRVAAPEPVEVACTGSGEVRSCRVTGR